MTHCRTHGKKKKKEEWRSFLLSFVPGISFFPCVSSSSSSSSRLFFRPCVRTQKAGCVNRENGKTGYEEGWWCGQEKSFTTRMDFFRANSTFTHDVCVCVCVHHLVEASTTSFNLSDRSKNLASRTRLLSDPSVDLLLLRQKKCNGGEKEVGAGGGVMGGRQEVNFISSSCQRGHVFDWHAGHSSNDDFVKSAIMGGGKTKGIVWYFFLYRVLIYWTFPVDLRKKMHSEACSES